MEINKSLFSLKKPISGDKYGNWGVTISRGGTTIRMYAKAGEIIQLKAICEEVISSFVTGEIEINVSESNTKSFANQRSGEKSF